MLGKKKISDQPPPLLARDKQIVAELNKEAYNRLGDRYLWFNKIRTAKKGHFPFLEGKNLEEQMEATRSALILVGKQLNGSLATAFNGTLDAVHNSGAPFEGLPEKLEIADRSDPPPVTDEQDAMILAFFPIRFLNLSKIIRDKGKGIDFYAEGLIKKFFFKVLAYYADPGNWNRERLGFMFEGLTEESTLEEVGSKLSALKADLELFSSCYEIFRFGRQSRGPADASTKNTLEETFEISTKELVTDLHLQTFIVNGMVNFLFKYYLTLMAIAPTPKAYRPLTAAFMPAMARAEAVRVRFQASFNMEKDKIRIRQDYMEFYKAEESKPPAQLVKIKGREVRKFHYSNKLLDLGSYARVTKLTERQAQLWQVYFKAHLVDRADSPAVPVMLNEILFGITQLTHASVKGRLEVAGLLRTFAADQEKIGLTQVARKKKTLDEKIRDKRKTIGKFKSTEQFDMVKTIEQELAQMDQQGKQEISTLENSITKRREAMLERAKVMAEQAKAEGEKNLGLTARTVYAQLAPVDVEKTVRAVFIPYLLQQVQQAHPAQNEDIIEYADYYKHLFTVVGDLTVTEKIVMREALASRIQLSDDDMVISPDEQRAYDELISAQITELSMELPQALEYKLVQGTVNTTLGKLLDCQLTNACMKVLLQVPLNLPNKPAAKLPTAITRRILTLNQLKHPFPKNDVLLTDVADSQPAVKRIAFNRLGKLLG